jgi:hypothetical protein
VRPTLPDIVRRRIASILRCEAGTFALCCPLRKNRYR